MKNYRSVWYVVILCSIVILSIVFIPFRDINASPAGKSSGLCPTSPFHSILSVLPDEAHNKTVLKNLRDFNKVFFKSEHAFGKKIDKNTTAQTQNDPDVASIKTSAAERKALLLEAMEADPDAVLTEVLLPSEQTTVASVASDCVEQTQTIQGRLEIDHADFFEEDQDVNEYVLLSSGGERTRLDIAGVNGLRLESGAKLNVTGFKLDHDMLVNGTDPQAIQPAQTFSLNDLNPFKLLSKQALAAVPGSIGPQHTIVVLVNFTNAPTSVTPSVANDMVFNQLNSYYQENSYGQTSVNGDVIGPITLPISSSCDVNTIFNNTVTAADPSVYFPDYSRLIIIGPMNNCGFAGAGTVGISYTASSTDGQSPISVAWMPDAYLSLGSVGHEFGHNLGLSHANYLNCYPLPIATSTNSCSSIEYGDTFDIMSSIHVRQMNAHNKDYIGWFDQSNIALATTGTYTLSPIESTSTTLKVLKIPRLTSWYAPTGTSITDYLWVEYRQPIGVDATIPSNIFQGALLHIDVPNDIHSFLIGSTPPPDASNPTLLVNNTFVDPLTETQVTVLGTTSDSLTVSVVQGKSDFTTPTGAITSPAANDTVSGTITVSADASDADSGVEKVMFYSYFGNQYLGTSFAPPYSVSVDTTQLQNGTVGVYAVVYDKSGEAYNALANTYNTPTVLFTIANTDSVPPVVWIVSPLASSTLSTASQVQMTASSTDDVGVFSIKIYLSTFTAPIGTFYPSLNPPPFTSSWFLGAGVKTVYAVAQDYAGNISTSTSVNFTVANPPTVSITQPTSGAVVSGIVSVQATSTSSVGISKVELYVDNVLTATSSTSPYIFNWDTTSLAPGSSHSLVAIAYDTAGLTKSSVPVSVFIQDLTPPTVALTQPLQGAVVSGLVTFAATASSSTGISKVEFYNNNNLFAVKSTSPFSFGWNVSLIYPAGTTLSLQAKAYSNSGGTATSTPPVTVTVADVTPPTVSLTQPTPGANVQGSVQLTASASDNVAVSKVEFYADGALVGTSSTSPYGVSWDTSSYTAGSSHTLQAKAYDASGNTATSSSITVTVLASDTTPPSISMTQPSNNAKVTGTVSIAATASDNIAVSKVEFYADNALIGTKSTSPYSVNWNTTSLTVGSSHTLLAKAYDTSNNTASSSVISVTIADVIAPTVSLTQPANNAKVSKNVSLAATASDNVAVAKVEFYADGALVSTSSTSPYTGTWNATALTAGSSHTLVAKAYDTSNNTASSTAVIVTIADTTVPTTSITSPANNSMVNHSTNVTISATASDNIGVTKVEFYVNSTLKCTDTTSPYSCVWAVPATRSVVYSLQTKAYDAPNNMGSSTITKTTSK